MTEFGSVTQVREKHISRGRPHPIPRRRGPASRGFFGNPTYAQNEVTRYGSTWGAGTCFWGISHALVSREWGLSIPKTFWDPTYALTVWPKATSFGMATHILYSRSAFLGVSHVPVHSGQGTSVPQFFPPPPQLFDFVHVHAQYQKQQPNFVRW